MGKELAKAGQQGLSADALSGSLGKGKAIGIFAEQAGIGQGQVLEILRATAFRQRPGAPVATNEQLAALIVICNRYELDPFVRQIYCFIKDGILTPIVGVDGFAAIASRDPRYLGVSFEESPEEVTTADGKATGPAWVEATIQMAAPRTPIKVRERFTECYRNTTPWNDMPYRMMRHKAFIQAVRIALGLTGIYDHDEGEKIVNAQEPINATPEPAKSKALAEKLQDKAKQIAAPEPAPVSAVLDGKCSTCGGDIEASPDGPYCKKCGVVSAPPAREPGDD